MRSVAEVFPNWGPAETARLVRILKSLLKSAYFSTSFTGFVIAGFGHKETFPTLVSYEIDGVVGGRIKYKRPYFRDIDREGHKAIVLPFAQKDMVDRFIHGLDDDGQAEIAVFCRETVKELSDAIIGKLKFANDQDRKKIEQRAREAEKAFVTALRDKGFKSIAGKARKELENMVEFMPKPELAKMAEALINLTSIKRRVSRGMETVGEPVDVAVISKSEGFVWVKRKHYFPAELNARYYERVRGEQAVTRKEA